MQRSGCLLGAGRGRERPEIQVFSRLDIGHKDFLGEQFVNCRWSSSHHADVRMDFAFFIPPLPFYEGTLADFEPTLDTYVLVRAGGAPVPFPGEDRHKGR